MAPGNCFRNLKKKRATEPEIDGSRKCFPQAGPVILQEGGLLKAREERPAIRAELRRIGVVLRFDEGREWSAYRSAFRVDWQRPDARPAVYRIGQDDAGGGSGAT